MTLTQMTAALNEQKPNFGGDYAGYFDISDEKAERIAAMSASPEEFVTIWENEDS